MYIKYLRFLVQYYKLHETKTLRRRLAHDWSDVMDPWWADFYPPRSYISEDLIEYIKFFDELTKS